MKPKIAIHILPQHASYEKIRDAAIRAEEIGADIIYNWDYLKKMVLIGIKEKEEKENILNAGRCLQVGQR